MLTTAVPADEYQRRVRAREGHAAHCEKVHVWLGNTRLVLALTTVFLAWQAIGRHALSSWWLSPPIVAYACVAVYHSRVLRAQELANRAICFYRRGLARIEDHWAGTGQTGARFDDPHHEYAADLDLFGKGSLFELLSTARTRMGEHTLAAWLLAPASLDQIRKRHAAIRELRDGLDFREDLAVLGADAEAGVHPDALMNWAEAPNRMQPYWVRWLAFILATLTAAGGVLWVYQGISTSNWTRPLPLVLAVVVEAGIMYYYRRSVERVLAGSEQVFHDLSLLREVLARIETQEFNSPYLQLLQSELRPGAVTASHAIARLSSIVNWGESRRNLIIRAVNVPLMFSMQLAFVAEQWRKTHGSRVRSWLGVAGEMEALVSLAAYSYEHPADPFPDFTIGTAAVDSVEMGHPLIPAATCVRNDVSLLGGVGVLLISGSNMSGKSTLLRAVGVNVVLAMAGAPVRATRFRLTPLQVGASIRIHDSLQDGSSRFYAEITKLRKLFDLSGGDLPLLFLLDELLQGTNSRDRLIGAEGIISAFLNRGAIGLVSTHDLALTEMNGRISGRLRNLHFQEEFEGGRMHFDYKLREGVVTKSNGLELMRSIGLDV